MQTPCKYQLVTKVRPDLVCSPYFMLPGLGARASGATTQEFSLSLCWVLYQKSKSSQIVSLPVAPRKLAKGWEPLRKRQFMPAGKDVNLKYFHESQLLGPSPEQLRERQFLGMGASMLQCPEPVWLPSRFMNCYQGGTKRFTINACLFMVPLSLSFLLLSLCILYSGLLIIILNVILYIFNC